MPFESVVARKMAKIAKPQSVYSSFLLNIRCVYKKNIVIILRIIRVLRKIVKIILKKIW